MIKYKGKKIPELNEVEIELMNLHFCGGAQSENCMKIEKGCKNCLFDSRNVEEFKEWFITLYEEKND